MGFYALRHDREGIEMANIPKEAKQTYLDRRRADVNQCKMALDQRDWESIERIGHKMKGNAETFGFSILMGVGLELEKAAQLKDFNVASKALLQFERALESLSADSEY